MNQDLEAILKGIYEIIPQSIRRSAENNLKYHKKANLTNEVLAYLEQTNTKDEEVLEIISFLKENHIRPFPYSFKDKYDNKKIEVFTDDSGLHYVNHYGHKLFFKRDFNKKTVERAYRSLLAEQDVESPHKYLTPTFDVQEGDTLVDIGCSESFLTLENIEKVKKAYLIEADLLWKEALEKTFAPWKDKVFIYSKYASDIEDENNVSIDSLLENDNDIIAKLDVEGMESKVLTGMSKSLKDKRMKLLVCTYHKQNDLEELSNIVVENGFEYEPSKGYMLFKEDPNFSAPYLRRGLIRAQKK